jgi:hypothetical protein
MKKMKKIVAALVAAVAAFTVPARAEVIEVTEFPLAIAWDLDATTFNYPTVQGIQDAAIAATTRVEGALSTISSRVPIVTSGSSTTVSALTALSAPFNAIQVGDMIKVRTVGVTRPDVINAVEGEQVVWLSVVAKASGDSITVDRAVNLGTAGIPFEWRRAYIGGQIGRGWIPMRGFDRVKFSVWLAGTTDTAGFNVRVECRDDVQGQDTGSNVVVAPSHTAATAAEQCGAGALAAADQSCLYSDAVVTAGLGKATFTVDAAPWYECRVGVRINTADDGADAVVEAIRVEAALIKER